MVRQKGEIFAMPKSGKGLTSETSKEFLAPAAKCLKEKTSNREPVTEKSNQGADPCVGDMQTHCEDMEINTEMLLR